MTAQLVSSEAAAVYFERGEAPDPEAAKALIESLLRQSGLPVWRDMEIELFPGPEGALILARRADLREACCRFPDLESLLAAVPGCPPGYPARLYFCRGAYYLLLRLPEEALFELEEFCLDAPVGTREAAHIREHGRLLLARDAAAQLRKFFF